MSVKLVYQDIAVGAEEDAELSSSSATADSNLAQVPYGVEAIPLNLLELNYWGLTGTHRIKENQTIGFWSVDLSDEDGAFQTPPSLTINFNNNYTSLGISLRFDDATGGYAGDINVKWYQGSTLLSEKTYTPDSAICFCANTVQAYNKIVITFNSTNLPCQRLKLNQIVFGIVREFEIDELRSVNVLQEIDPISSELMINTMDWTLDSLEDVQYIFQQKQPVEAYDNDSLIGVFYIDKSKRRAENLYDISCVDAVGILDESAFEAAMYTNKNAKELIESILAGDFELDMDASLQSATVTGYISAGTRRDAIQQIAFAIGAIVDTSGSNKLVVSVLPTSSPKEISPERTYLGGNVETDAIVTAVRVTAHTYTQGSGSTGDDVVEVNGIKYVHTTSITTINNPNVTASDKPNVVEVKEATLINPANVASVAQRVYDYALRRSNHNLRFVISGEKPGDYVTTHTPYGDTLTGSITSMNITLSGLSAADANMKGA